MKKYIISFLIILAINTFAQSGNKSTNDLQIINVIQVDSIYNKDVFLTNEKIIACTKEKIICFDFNNNLLWEKQITDSLISNVILINSNLVYIDSNNELTLISIENGKIIQSIGLDIVSHAKIFSINYKGNNEFISTEEIISNNSLLLIFDNGTLLCLDLESLQEYWRKNYNDFFNSQPILINNKFLVLSKSGYINYFDSNNGLLLWRWKENEDFQIKSNPVLNDDKSVYFINNENYLFSINLLLGKLNWKIDGQKFITLLFISNDYKFLYAQNDKYNIVKISLLDGTIKNELKNNVFKELVNFSFNYKNQNYFVSSNSIYRFDKNKIKKILSNEFNLMRIISIKDDFIVLIDSTNRLLIIK